MKEKMRKALGFLGLIEDEYGDYASSVPARPFTDQPEYDNEPEWASPAPAPAPAPAPRSFSTNTPVAPSRAPASSGRTSSISVLDSSGQAPRMRPMPSHRAQSAQNLAPDREPAIFFPNSYNESRRITDLLRSSRAVVLNVTELEPGVSRRLVDFASGTAYALNAKIEPMAQGVYLICPQGTYVSADAKDRLRLTNFRSFETL